MPTFSDEGLEALLRWLKAAGYRFTAVTPATHARVLARARRGPADLRDALGWSRPFAPGDLPGEAVRLMTQAGLLEEVGEHCRSRLRAATLGADLFLHSAFPTSGNDAVFFGPDTYRFARFIAAAAPALAPPGSIVDMGAGSAAGGIAAARIFPEAALTLVDVNPAALRLARVNAAAAGVAARIVKAERVPPGADLVLANPPYMIDEDGRAYRHGGDLHGGAVALEWAEQALEGLNPGGTLLLYTGAAMIEGRAPLVEALRARCAEAGAACAVEELDPDVFGEELEKEAYAEVERIAALGITIVKR
ncbi:MAG: methyltransferase [Alphaproteobacteria bacterium]|nr:methyltransferase [Alphaproteobacteria bacterium]MBV9370524.1 methyltransferase [Alphaproteobacteria bacterium]MBV9901425.1 methyltransferase [Alphaproteobacteria bacterium]